MMVRNSVFLVLAFLGCAAAQTVRPKDIREMARDGSSAIPRIAQHLKNPDLEVRLEAVKAISAIGTARSLDPLVEATRDNDPEVQIRATDGLVNFYLPGYLRTGLSATLRRVGTTIKSKFTDVNDQVIDPYVQVRPEVIDALGKLARGGSSLEARANAARAAGILRGRAAVPDLVEAMRSKDAGVIYECLVAFQKIGDPSAGPRFRFLLRDLDERVQVAAIEGTGLLRNMEAIPDLIEVLNRERSTPRVRRAALAALAMLPDEKNRPLFRRYLDDRDEGLREAAAEGLGRLRNPADRPVLEKAYEQERRASARLSVAFALVCHGNTEVGEMSPLQLLINTLNSKARQGEAFAFLVEVARDAAVRATLHRAIPSGAKDERIYLARVLARSGDKTSVPELEKLSRDPDADVGQEALRALQNLKARL